MDNQKEFGYDRNSSRLWRDWISDTTDTYDWYYRYDGLDRLWRAERGKLRSNYTGIDILKFAQEWGLVTCLKFLYQGL